jgi:hypothetical protein
MYFNAEHIGDFIGLDIVNILEGGDLSSIVMGNSPIGNSSWRGEILGVAMFRGSPSRKEIQERMNLWQRGELDQLFDTPGTFLFYGFDERSGRSVKNRADGRSLTIPPAISPIKREFLSLPSRKYFKSWPFYRDAVVNVLGFIPFGLVFFLFYCFSRRRSGLKVAVVTVITGGALSLFIELNQAFLLSRNSSLTDLILNTLGTAVGVMIVYPIYIWIPHSLQDINETIKKQG